MIQLRDLPLAKISLARVYAQSAYNKFPAGKSSNKVFYKSRLTSAQAVLTRLPTCDVLAFRGSDRPLDWLINATAIPVPTRAGLCHAGFAAAHASLWRQIKKDLNRDKPLLITGHSLGGALAEISAALVKDFDTVWMITFGKPNVFLKRFGPDMSCLEAQISVVNGSDIVARLPKMLYGPSKTQTMLYFGLDNDHVNPSRALLKRELDYKAVFSHHLMPDYYDNLDQMLDRMIDAV